VSRLAESTSVTTFASTHVLHNHCVGFDFSVAINSKIYQIYSSIMSKMADFEAILISDDEAADCWPNSPLSSGCSLFQLSFRLFLLQPCFQLSKSLQGFRPRFTIISSLLKALEIHSFGTQPPTLPPLEGYPNYDFTDDAKERLQLLKALPDFLSTKEHIF
jgi:hypothetical protein